MSPDEPRSNEQESRVAHAAVWLPGLVVALGAAAATAHGLFEVAVAARVPTGIAWLYPLITDGLALVAYAATNRLNGRAARYAGTVVVIAAGLSGLAQAAYLASGPAVEVAPALRFGVGAWPAIAAAVAAHLLHLLTTDPSVQPDTVHPEHPRTAVQRDPFNAAGVQSSPDPGAVQSDLDDPDSEDGSDRPDAGAPGDPGPRVLPSPARDRAEDVATRLAQRHGTWPTVTELEAAAEVSRGTAAAALKAVRGRPLPLHLINTSDNRDITSSTDTDHGTRP